MATVISMKVTETESAAFADRDSAIDECGSHFVPFAPAFVVEGKIGRYSIFPQSPIVTLVVVNVFWFEVQRTDLRPRARLKVLTNITSNNMKPLSSFRTTGGVIWWEIVEGDLGFHSIDSHHAVALLFALGDTAVMWHSRRLVWTADTLRHCNSQSSSTRCAMTVVELEHLL